jgi:5-methylcytosine-specific restriction enzyme A
MKNVKYIVYRFLTDADFFNIYKPPKTERGGGGQTYIDFQTTFIPVERWHSFFDGVTDLIVGERRQGPEWEFPVHSIGIISTTPQQILVVYQRRSASVCISSQNIYTRNGNRVHAWHPSNGFPVHSNPTDRQQLPDGLAVFLARTYDDEVWAGWFNSNDKIYKGWADDGVRLLLSSMFAAARNPGDAGILDFKEGQIKLDTNNIKTPMVLGSSVNEIIPFKEKNDSKVAKKALKTIQHHVPTEQELIDTLFNEDEIDSSNVRSKERTVILKIKQRNKKAVKALKQLYNNRCQVSGSRLTFKKQDGTYYSEAHHLVPLGDGGADDPRNIIIVSPLIHKMLHYATVDNIDLTKIKQQPSGESYLNICINGEEMIITWHAEHAKRVLTT